MATVSKQLAMEIIAADGYYADDPRVMQVIEYTDRGGELAYGLEYTHQIGKYAESKYVRNPKLYWKAEP